MHRKVDLSVIPIRFWRFILSRADFDQEFDAEFQQEAKCMLDACDDPDCMFCQKDDADAAFWDEFMSDPDDQTETQLFQQMHIVDVESGEELNLEGLNLQPYTVLKFN